MEQYPDISPDEFVKIERYLAGEMESAEKTAFEEELNSKPDLLAKANEIRLLLTGVRQAALAAELDSFHETLSRPVVNLPAALKPVNYIRRWMIAASVIVLAGLAIWFARNSMGGPENKQFARYFEKDPGLISAMSTTDNYEFDRAMIDYKQGNYAAAINSWENLLSEQPANDTLLYFIGSAWLADKQSAKAIPYFQKLLEHSGSVFLKETYWYLGLALVREGEDQEAIAMLRLSERPEKEELIASLKE